VFFQDRLAERLDLTERHRFKSTSALKAKRETADAGE
jgi:hypothetical protein